MGTSDTFDEVVKKTQLQVRAFVRGCGVPLDYVDDIAQETYLAFYRKREGLPRDVEPVRWLKGVARKLCFNHFRESKRREDRIRGAIAEVLATSQSRWEESQRDEMALHALRACMGKISEKNRRLTMLRYEKKNTSRNIGKAANMGAESVRKALHRVRAFLRKCIGQFLNENETHDRISGAEIY